MFNLLKLCKGYLTQFLNQLYKSNATYILLLHGSLTSQTFRVFSNILDFLFWNVPSSFLTQFQNQLYKSNATYILMLHGGLTSQTFKVFSDFLFWNVPKYDKRKI